MRQALERRAAMVREQIARRGIEDERILEALRTVPREEFVPPGLVKDAFMDSPLPIGEGQTISQPFIVALMTDALGLKGDEKVLEIGTGSGYQTAVLSILAREVRTIERKESLAVSARERLERLGYGNIVFKAGDGTLGIPEAAPFDAVMVTAAAPEIPPPLKEQLAEGGRMIIPSGPRSTQNLIRVTRRGGEYDEEILEAVRFVPLVGLYGYR